MTEGGGSTGIGNVFSIGIDGTNYQNLISFTGTGGMANGWRPEGSLTLSVGGTTLYGMTALGGTLGYGNIFSVGTNGTDYQNLVSFTGTGGTASGSGPNGSLTLSGTTLYGMTEGGGSTGIGNVFSIGTDGTNYQNLVGFENRYGTLTGFYPLGSLTLGGTTLYGMTSEGGNPLYQKYTATSSALVRTARATTTFLISLATAGRRTACSH